MANIISFLKERMSSCFTLPDDQPPLYPPTAPEGSGDPSSIEKGGPSKGETSPPYLTAAPEGSGHPSSSEKGGPSKGDPSPPYLTAAPEGSGHPSSSEKGGPSKGEASSVPRVCDLTDNIMEAAAVAIHGKESDNVNLDVLIKYIEKLLEIIREKPSLNKLAKEKWEQKISSKKKLPAPNFWSMITSKELLNFKEFLTGVTDFASGMKDIFSANTVAVKVLEGIGHASLATASFLVIATVLEKFENVSEIQEDCLNLLEEMNSLAKHVRKLQKVPRLREELEDPLKKATELILAASILCCFQIDSSRFARFFSMADNKQNLLQFRKELEAMYRDMDYGKYTSLYDAVSDIAISQKRRKPVPIEYPRGTVGMDEPLKRVKELLDLESEKKALAVVIHGFGGLGKTTLADAVYATLFDTVEGCKYSMVKLFDTIESTPNVINLQTQMIKDLRMGTTEEADVMPEIKTFEEGQREISRLLDQQVALIYIDNVLLPDKIDQHRDALELLLPKNMKNARKLRLLLTARDKTATDSITSVNREFYPIESLRETEAENLIKNMLVDIGKQLNPSQIAQIVSICGGVPKLLTVVAGFVGSQENPKDALDTVMEEKKNKWKGKIGDDIKCYVFACKNLKKDLREAFLDICSFFQGWEWEELSNIVGKPALNSLQRRALVTKDVKSMTATVHDIILTVGLRETEKERFRFSSASEIDEFLDQEDEALGNIKGIWLSDNSEHPLHISATKLELMAGSLRVLKLGPLTFVEGKCEKKFKELVFFSAGISHLPFDVSKSEELRHLCYSPEDLKNLTQMPSNLRHKSPFFQISSKCIKQLSELRVLRLKNAEFTTLPQDLGDLGDGNLQELTLSNCKLLQQLPESISTLGSLRALRMDSCSRLKQLPEDFGSLISLQELRLGGCSILEALPRSLEELSSLRLLELSNCRSIEDLPDGLGNLTSLVNLLLDYCINLRSIPESIWRLNLLDSIILSSADLEELPDRFCDLSSITKLTMDRCWSLHRLPDRFGAVRSLRRLSLRSCWRLQKLPESFSQLKYLEYLNLSDCEELEELCEHFKGLSSLRVLLLAGCRRLEKLPEDFHCLPSLDTLDLNNCYMLEGKSMDSIVKLEKLQTLFIWDSPLLLEKWGEIKKQSDQSWSFAVETGQGSFQAKDNFNLTNGQGKAFSISDLPLKTKLLVLFDCQQEFSRCSTLTLIEENIDDNLEMIYFGDHFKKLPNKVASGIRGHAPAELFRQLFPFFAYREETKFQLSAIKAKIVHGEKGDKNLSFGEILDSKKSLEEFVVKKCRRYLKLKQLVQTTGDSNIELLRELFANGEEKTSYGFLKNGASAKVGVEELKGKTILLDMRPANLSYVTPLQSLVDLYNVAEKERFDFEIITIPMMQDNTRRDVSNSFSCEVPWLVLQNPWELPNATKYFLVEGCEPFDRLSCEAWYPSKMKIIESNGTIAACNRPGVLSMVNTCCNRPGVLSMVNTWGTEAYPFTKEKRKELIEKEVKQMKEMSNLMFLFQRLQRISEQVENAMGQQKMICLCLGDCTTSLKSMLVEWNDNIYTIYIPNLLLKGRETVYFTHGISEKLEHPMVSQVEMEGMFSVSLSEYEAIRYWARIYSLFFIINLYEDIEDEDEDEDIEDEDEDEDENERFNNLKKLLKVILENGIFIYNSSIIIMDADGNLITEQGKEIIELLGEEHSHDKAKGLVQRLIIGDKESRKEALIELEQLMNDEGRQRK